MKKLKWEVAKKELKNKIVFLEFFTIWCPDCKMMEPIIEEVEKEVINSDLNIEFIKVDAEEADLLRKNENDFQVLKVPSFLLVKNGKANHIGYEYLPKDFILEKIKLLLKKLLKISL